MPLTDKGQKIRRGMEREYGRKKGEQVFYASRNKGVISGVDSQTGEVESYMDAVRRGDAEAMGRHFKRKD